MVRNRIVVFSLFAFLLGCAPSIKESELKVSLEIVLKDDLVAIIGDIEPKYLLKEPFYEIVEWKGFESGRYRWLAVVDFYFMDDVKILIRRKYRFDSRYQKWDRYFNEYYKY